MTAIPHLEDLQRSFIGLAMAHLKPSGLPVVVGVPGVSGGVGGPDLRCCQSQPRMAVGVIIAWLAKLDHPRRVANDDEGCLRKGRCRSGPGGREH